MRRQAPASVVRSGRATALATALGLFIGLVGMIAESGAAGLVAGIIGSGSGLVIAAGVVASLLGGVIPAIRAASSSPMAAMRS